MKSFQKLALILMTAFVFSCANEKITDKNFEYSSTPAFSETANEEEVNLAGSMDSEKQKGPKDQLKASGGRAEGKEVAPVFERKLIKNGDLSFETKSLKDTKSQINAALKSVDGYIAKETVYDYRSSPTEELTVRVPSKDFDQFLERILEGVEELDSKHINIEDVSEEFVDIEARLKNKKQLEEKYKELMTRAVHMDDILSIEREISSIRGEIEATEGRLRYLSNQVGYSTIQIRYYEAHEHGFHFGGKLGEALKTGGTGFMWFIIIMVQLWPLWLIGVCIWYLIVWLIRRNRRKKGV